MQRGEAVRDRHGNKEREPGVKFPLIALAVFLRIL